MLAGVWSALGGQSVWETGSATRPFCVQISGEIMGKVETVLKAEIARLSRREE